MLVVCIICIFIYSYPVMLLYIEGKKGGGYFYLQTKEMSVYFVVDFYFSTSAAPSDAVPRDNCDILVEIVFFFLF